MNLVCVSTAIITLQVSMCKLTFVSVIKHVLMFFDVRYFLFFHSHI